MKIMQLTPCLMLDNNREANIKAMEYFKQTTDFDYRVIYDQQHQSSDYLSGFEYIGHQEKRQGFVKPRNELLKYFYNSDADYAFWIDANERVSLSSQNDLNTIIDAIKSNKLPTDVHCIHATIGIYVSQERILAKQMPDYSKNAVLIPCHRGYNWMHGMFLLNLKKHLGCEVYIDKRCDPHIGWSQDVYFSRVMQQKFNSYLCPILTLCKPSNKTSTWMQNANGYAYPPVDNYMVDMLIKKHQIPSFRTEQQIIRLPRIRDEYLANLTPYKPRNVRRKKK